MKVIEVVAGILVNNDEYLCMQRGLGKYDYLSQKFEFPGGKIESGESREMALMRELKEEMDIDVIVGSKDYFMTVEHDYPDFRIIMHSYIVNFEARVFNAKEHMSHRWVKSSSLMELDWAKADIPIAKCLSGR